MFSQVKSSGNDWIPLSLHCTLAMFRLKTYMKCLSKTFSQTFKQIFYSSYDYEFLQRDTFKKLDPR